VNSAELLAELSRRGIELRSSGDELRYRAAKGTLTPELRATISVLKSELLAILPAQGLCICCGTDGLRARLTDREGGALWCPQCLYAEAERQMAPGRRPQ